MYLLLLATPFLPQRLEKGTPPRISGHRSWWTRLDDAFGSLQKNWWESNSDLLITDVSPDAETVWDGVVNNPFLANFDFETSWLWRRGNFKNETTALKPIWILAPLSNTHGLFLSFGKSRHKQLSISTIRNLILVLNDRILYSLKTPISVAFEILVILHSTQFWFLDRDSSFLVILSWF